MDTKALDAIALSVRSLSMDGVQAANSGHPGLPLGCAELGAALYGEILNIHPAKSSWADRDRFILSAGHGSMFVYSLLHLAGFDLPYEELKKFRQLGSKTPGHPEYGYTDGVETTTGPLGAGFTNAVGMAMAETVLAAKFNTKEHTIVDHYTYALSGDGCMMEGITSEAASLAGHLGLGKLIVFYDSNKITIEGSTDLAFTEDVAKRYEAYNWQVLKGDMYSYDDILKAVEQAKAETGKPTLVILKSTIGKGSPNKQGTHGVHGSPLGPDEIVATRKALGIGENDAFYIAPEAKAHFDKRRAQWADAYSAWETTFAAWAKANPELKAEWDQWMSDTPDLSKVEWPSYAAGDSLATRSASGKALQAVAKAVSSLYGGSADLAPSNNTAIPYGDYSKEDRTGRTFHFGVREHGMGGIVNGLILHGGLRVFCATFLVFADYMRPAIRLASIMKLPVTYIFTHDSFYVGEDGPTHQPVETIASLRIIPGVTVLRPADAEETTFAWKWAMEKTDGPVVLALTRQNLTVFDKPAGWEASAKKGAYIAKDCEGTPETVILASGSEVNLAMDAAALSSKKVRVVSVISLETLKKQDGAFVGSLIPAGARVVVAEAGVKDGWEGFATDDASILCMRGFGESGSYKDLAKHFGFVPEHLVKLL